MKNRAYRKSIKREILSSKGRFISIMAIIFLGVGFYAGIKSCGPDLEQSINEYFAKQNLMDSKIVSTLGLTDNDLKLLENNDKILDYYASHSVDVNLTNSNNVVKFMEYDEGNSEKFNTPVIVEGRLPQNSGEITLDENASKIDPNLKIGSKYIIQSDKDSESYFKQKTFKIVGFVKSPMYIDATSRGTTTVGKGSIDYFALINKSDLSMDAYSEIYVKFRNTENLEAYSDEYKDQMEENTEYLENLFSDRGIERVEEIKSDAQKEFDKAYKEIEENEKKLEDAQNEIDNGKMQLLDGQKQYEKALTKFNKEISDNEKLLSENEIKLNEGQVELDKQKEILLQGEKDLENGKTQIDKSKESFLNQGIDPTKDTKKYEEQIEGLSTLISTYDQLSKDIKNSTNNLNENNEIPNEKIQYWKAMISNPNLGLDKLSNLINNLEKDPSNISLALTISESIDNISKGLEENKSKLETLVDGVNKYQEVVKTYETESAKISAGKIKLKEAQDQLDKGKQELEQGKQKLEEAKKQGENELNKAKKELDESKQKLIDGQKEIEENKAKLLDAREEVDNEKEKLNELEESKYYFFDRNDNQGYSSYKGSIESLDKIASVFPVFFFLVAALICLTTMTRMVEENRVEIGTLKALGYRDLEIARKYIVYASIASFAGAIVGILAGCNLLPFIVNSAYSSKFILPDVIISLYPSYIIQSFVISLICTVGASFVVLKEELKENPSDLMRAKAPKLGKKILLERLTFIWKRLNFNQKVTFRNLFRYKRRMFMTVFGISGCMAMLVSGIALQKSNTSLGSLQFDKIIKYDAMVVFEDNSTEKENEQYNKSLSSLENLEESLNAYQEAVTFSKKDISKQSAMMYVIENTDKVNNFILLNDRASGTKYKLSDDGVMINEKLAKLLKVSEGDYIIMTDADNNDHKLKVDHIVENYLGHYIYLSPSYYEKAFNKDIKYNIQLLNFSSKVKDEDELLTKLMDNEKVINVTLKSKMKSIGEAADLGLVMLVIIVASGSLAFVVLYNLININVSERIREISTIKVLGFYDSEVDMYIFRENIILTLMGIVVGSGLGKLLYIFLISTAETDNMMMSPTVNMSNYIISGVITMIFALLVMIMMHKKLKNINMIDALKSVE